MSFLSTPYDALRRDVDAIPGERFAVDVVLLVDFVPRSDDAVLGDDAGTDDGARADDTPLNVRAVVHDALRHRLILSYEASAEGLGPDDVLRQLVEQVAVP